MESNMENQQTFENKQIPFEGDEENLEGKCLEFAETLGLDEPVSVAVLEAAISDESYAHNLMTSRRSPVMLQYLLANPPKPRATAGQQRFSNTELVKKAATAILKWGKVGFTVVDQDTLERRRAACFSCSHLIDPPDQVVYRLTGADESQKICELCGCNVRKKIKLPTESCPDRHPDQASMNRWGEPWHSE